MRQCAAGKTGDEAIAQLNEQYQMYIMVEQQLQQKRARLMGKMPETQRALDAVNLLIQKREADETVQLISLLDNPS